MHALRLALRNLDQFRTSFYVILVVGPLLDRDIYLLDEPTSHLDRRTEQRAIDFLRRRL